MTMFDLKDSEDINIRNCHTDSSTLLKVDGVKRAKIEDSTAFAKRPATSATPKRGLRKFLIENIFITLLTVLGGLAVAYLAWRFGWT